MIIGNPIVTGRTNGKKPLITLTEGDIIKVNENGAAVGYYLADKSYLPDLNGRARMLLVRKDIYGLGAWNETGANTYADSTIDNLLNITIKSLYDADLQTAMGETVFPYTPGNSDNEVATLSRSVFLLSQAELGAGSGYGNTEGESIPSKVRNILKVAYMDSVATGQWLRSPRTDGTDSAFYFTAAGKGASDICTALYGVRPCFTLPGLETVDPSPDEEGAYTLSLSYAV